MNSPRFIPTSEQWANAEAEANRRAPSPQTSSALAGAFGFFGGGLISFLALTLAGVSPDGQTTGAVSTGLAALTGLAGVAITRSRERSHGEAFARVLEGYEREWRMRQDQENSSKIRGPDLNR